MATREPPILDGIFCHESADAPRLGGAAACSCGCPSPAPGPLAAVPAHGASFPARAPGGARRARRHLSLLPAILLVVLPKCPLCVAAYLGVAGSLGASPWIGVTWGLPLGLALLAFTLAALGLRAYRSGDYRPPLVGLAGAAALLAGKFALGTGLLVYPGAALLVGCSIWSVRVAAPRRPAT